MPDIVLHHLNKSRSHRVLWLLEELGLPYTLTQHTRDPRTMRAPKAMRDLHPLGKAPILVVDGVVLAETGAILEYVLDTLADGALRPAPGTPAHQAFRYWLHYAEGSLMPPLLVKLIASQVAKAPPKLVRPLLAPVIRGIDAAYADPEIALHTRFLESSLAGRDWFAGDAFSAADIQLSYPIEALLSRGGVDAPNLSAWVARIRGRAAYQRAVEVGGEPGF